VTAEPPSYRQLRLAVARFRSGLHFQRTTLGVTLALLVLGEEYLCRHVARKHGALMLAGW
jgi:hypothetical protein